MKTQPTRDSVVSTLRSSVCKVVFNKTNGDVRTLYGTLKESLIPTTAWGTAEKKRDEKTQKNVRENTVAVWDTEKAAWRSFNLPSLISIEPIQD
jgi:hypothetical protein